MLPLLVKPTQLLHSCYKNNFMYLYQFDWTREFYDCIHHPISALWTFPKVPVNLFYGNHRTDNWTYNLLHSWTKNSWNNKCIMDEVWATSIFSVCEINFFHQLRHKIISRIFSRRASVDKCIKCSGKFCNIFWKTWSAEAHLVNLLELQPPFF